MGGEWHGGELEDVLAFRVVALGHVERPQIDDARGFGTLYSDGPEREIGIKLLKIIPFLEDYSLPQYYTGCDVLSITKYYIFASHHRVLDRIFTY